MDNSPNDNMRNSDANKDARVRLSEAAVRPAHSASALGTSLLAYAPAPVLSGHYHFSRGRWAVQKDRSFFGDFKALDMSIFR